MKNSITTKMLLDLDVDVSEIPAKNLPKSYVIFYLNKFCMIYDN